MKIRICKNLDNLTSGAVTVACRNEKQTAFNIVSAAEAAYISPLFEQEGYLCACANVFGKTTVQRALTVRPGSLYKTGETLETFDVGGILCAVAVDTDALRPEIFRSLALKGVKVVFCTQLFERENYCEDDILFGAWANAQANNLFVVSVSNIEANIICPCSLSPDDSGFLVRGAVEDVCIELPIERFYEGQRSFPVFQSLNYSLYSKYFSGSEDRRLNTISQNKYSQPKINKKAHKILSSIERSAPETKQDENTTVCAVQYKLRPMCSVKEYLQKLDDIYFCAAQHGAKLIAFPELFGLTPLCTKPIIKKLFSEKASSAQPFYADSSPIELRKLHVDPNLKGVLPAAAKLLVRIMRRDSELLTYAFSYLSRKYSIITASGSSLELCCGKLYNTQVLFDEHGQIIGSQRKINPMESELALGINYAEEIDVFETSIGKIAIPVCMDASYFENFRIMRKKGAEIVAMGTFNLEEYNKYLALRGIIPRCSEFPLFAVKAAMTGYAVGTKATGFAEIAAPCSVAKGGLLAQSLNSYGCEPVFAALPPSTDLSCSGIHFPTADQLLSELYHC